MLHPKSIIKYYGLKINYHLGQNFLIEPAIAQSIAISAGINNKDIVLEIGSGLGILTLSLAKLAAKVITLEVDKKIYKILLKILSENKLTNVEAQNEDALTFDLSAKKKQIKRKVKIVANLPYSISIDILFNLINNLSCWSSATFMVQYEVAKRLLAMPGERKYGQLSVLIQCWCEIKAGLIIESKNFFPRPQVKSQIIHLAPRKQPLIIFYTLKQKKWYNQIVKSAFNYRRKTILNSLTTSQLLIPRTKIIQALNHLNFDSNRRAETLTPQELGQLAQELDS